VSEAKAYRPGRWRPRLGHLLDDCLAAVAHFGNAVCGVSGFILPYQPLGAEPPELSVPLVAPPQGWIAVDAMPPGHPERLLPHVPLSATERWLAAQLD
jgi:Family of unknown function (DUF6059)